MSNWVYVSNTILFTVNNLLLHHIKYCITPDEYKITFYIWIIYLAGGDHMKLALALELTLALVMFASSVHHITIMCHIF